MEEHLVACLEEHEWAATVLERAFLFIFVAALFLCTFGILTYGALNENIKQWWKAIFNFETPEATTPSGRDEHCYSNVFHLRCTASNNHRDAHAAQQHAHPLVTHPIV